MSLPFLLIGQANYHPQYGYSRSMESLTDYRRPDGFSEWVARSGQEQKLLLLIISSVDHIESHQLQTETLNNPQVMLLLDHGFLYYQARTGRHYAHAHQLSRRFGIQTYPSMALMNSQEEILWQHEGFISPSGLINQLARFLPATTPAINPSVLNLPVDPAPRINSDSASSAFLITDNLETAIPSPTQAKPKKSASQEPSGIEGRPDRVPHLRVEYGLVIKTARDLQEIQQMARRWQLFWKGDLWIQRMQNDAHRLILGSIKTEREARQKRRELRKENGIRARLYSFRPAELGTAILKY